jgi:hypothetical protein
MEIIEEIDKRVGCLFSLFLFNKLCERCNDIFDV